MLQRLRAANIEYRVFFHTWLLRAGARYNNVWSNEYDVDLDRYDYLYIPATRVIAEEYPPLDLSPYNVHGDPWQSAPNVKRKTGEYFQHTLRMSVYALLSLYRATQMWRTEPCTRVMYTRPDVRYSWPFRPEWLTREHDILVPNFACYPMNDRFALGPPDRMLLYGERFLRAPEYARHKALHSESFLQWIFATNNWPIVTIDFEFAIIRVNGIDGGGIDRCSNTRPWVVISDDTLPTPRPLNKTECKS